MLIITSQNGSKKLVSEAIWLADRWHAMYVSRRNRTIKSIKRMKEAPVYVVGDNEDRLYPANEDRPLFFHPSMALLRVKRLQNGETDPFIEATQLKRGMSVLDCTLGLGSDSIVASFVSGIDGKVVAIEGNRYVARLVQKGLKHRNEKWPELTEAMRRIEVVNDLYEDVLKKMPTNGFDVVYVDPMFHKPLTDSTSIKPLRPFALSNRFSRDAFREARRVARKKVVLKDHYDSPIFEQFSLVVHRRKHAPFHFGVLDVEM